MKHISRQSTYTDINYFITEAFSLSDKEPDLYLPIISRFSGTGFFERSYSLPYETIHIVEKGRAKLKLDGKVYHLKKGDFVVIFRGQKIEIKEDESNPLSYTWLDLKGTVLQEVFGQLGISRENCLFRGNYDEMFRSQIAEICTCYENSEIEPIQPFIFAWKIVDLIKNYITPTSRAVSLSDQIMRVIRSEFRQNLSIDELARRFSTDRTTIFRQFKRNHSMSPKQYIDMLRIEYAKKMLLYTQSSVDKVAAESGYGSSQNFFTQFKKSMKISPLKWRKNFLAE